MTPARMLHQLGILFGMASTIHSSPSYHQPGLAPSSHHLFARETSSCQDIQSSFPSTFKCSSDKYCISTDDASTALCCAAGNNCTQIAPITCDIQKQNASVVPNSLIFTTRLRDSLPKCGDKCCPFGFECTPDPNTAFCQIILDKSSLSGAVVDGSKLSASSTISATSSAASATDSSSLDSSQSLPKASHNPFPPTVFLAGLLPGLVIGILLTLAWVIYTKRNKKPDSPRTSGSSFSDRRPIISAPIPVENSTRTDFIRRAANKTKSVFSVRTDERVDSNPWNVKMPTPPVDNNIPRQIPGIPVTPVNQTAAYRKPSIETIQVYSPPSLIQHPSAVVPPLRRTAGQRGVSDAGLGQPFQTPPKSNQATGYEMSGASLGEILTPSRYSGAGQGPSDSRYEDKRDTTFTQMMAYCNMPDKGDSFPVPKVPEQYNSKNRI